MNPRLYYLAAFLSFPVLGLSLARAQSRTQVPPVIQEQVAALNDRFVTVLSEECDTKLCFPVGCETSNFLTLDEKQSSSLPGLEEEAPAGKVQYKLESVVCEFTHEASLKDDMISSLRQRLAQKVKLVGVNVQIRARELAQKPEESTDKEKPAPEPVFATWQAALWNRLLPFIPWLVVAIVVTVLGLVITWGLRTIGRRRDRDPNQRTRTTDFALTVKDDNELVAEPTPHMLITRITQLRDELAEDPKLVEQTLKKHFEEENYEELCRFLRNFGPQFLTPFKNRAEYKDALSTLSTKYNEIELDESPAAIWVFLSRLERAMTAAKVRIDHQPLEDEFSFLITLEVEEFMGILREVPETEAVAAVAYAPRRLREKFFAVAGPAFTSKFIEQLSLVERLPDSFMREIARRLRQIYQEKGDALKTIKVDRMPLLEQALNALEPDKRKKIVVELGRDNPDFMNNVVPVIFLDDSLPFVPDKILTEAFLTVTPKEAAAYLTQYPWGSEVLDKLNPRLRDAIKSAQGQATAPAQVSGLSGAARAKIAEFIREKDRTGAINLKVINGHLFGKI